MFLLSILWYYYDTGPKLTKATEAVNDKHEKIEGNDCGLTQKHGRGTGESQGKTSVRTVSVGTR